MGWLGEYKMGPKHVAVNAHQEPTRSSYNSWMTSSYQEVLSAPLRALNYEEKWTRPRWSRTSWSLCNQLSGNSFRCNALLPHAKFSIHSGCLIVHLFQVGVIPYMQLPPLAVAVYVLQNMDCTCFLWATGESFHFLITTASMRTTCISQINAATSQLCNFCHTDGCTTSMDAPTREQQVSFVGKSDAGKMHLMMEENFGQSELTEYQTAR